MKKILLLLLASFALQAQESFNLMPVPKSVQAQNGSLSINSNFSVSVHTSKPDTILLKAVNRMYQTLNRKTGLYFAKEYIKFQDKSDTATLQIKVKNVVLPVVGNDESYSIKVTNRTILLEAASTSGALYGLETLLQLCTKKGNSFEFSAVVINDAPRFQWRGLMIDVSRHFVPFDVIERNIEAMAAVKMNVLHLHLTDDQGFRIESKTFPQLHQKGSNGDFFTQAQIKQLVAFAQERGIEIVPEFDMPGHSKSWFAGYPQLASTAGTYEAGSPVDFSTLKGRDIGSIMKLINTAPFPSIDPSKETTYIFLEKFLKEMSALFPSPYIHIGADENNGVSWKNNPDIVAFMQKNKIADVHALQAYFVNRVSKMVEKNHKKMIGWEELFSKELPKDVTVQVWQNGAFLKKALENGNPALISKGFYLDLFMPAHVHYNNPDVPKESGNLLKGGEAAQWTEIADKSNIETRIWPRAAAIAERLWSSADVTDIDDMYRRLFIINKQLDDRGLQHIGNYAKALRQYSGEQNSSTLKTFTDVLTPVKGYKKLFARFTMLPNMSHQTAPLVEVSDIIFVDSEVKWEFRAAVQSYLKNKDTHSEKILSNYLSLWKQNDEKLKDTFANSTQIKRVEQHSKNLEIIANIGEQALEKIKSGTTPSNEWINQSMAALKEASKAYAETELAIVSEIEALIKQQMIPVPTSYSVF